MLTQQNSETGKRKIIPIWHNITQKELSDYSPSIADIYALNSTSDLHSICTKIIKQVQSISVEPSLESNPITVFEEQRLSPEEILKQVKTKQGLINAVENHLVDDRDKIRLFKLVSHEIEFLYSKLQEDFIDLMAQNPTGNLIKTRMQNYDNLCENALAMLVRGCYWGNSNQNKYWIKSVERIVNAQNGQSGYMHLLSLQYYPALLLMYGAGLAALANENYSLLKGLWQDVGFYENRTKKPALEKLYPGAVIDKALINQAQGSRFHTPVNDHLYEMIRPEFLVLIPEDEEFAILFDMFEYLMGLQIGYLSQCEDNSYFWAPLGRFQWRYQRWARENTPSNIVAEAIKTQGENWPPLKAGLWGSSLKTLETLKQKYDALLAGIHWF